MKPATFIPARNARHRIAVIALYRALLRVGNKFPTPEECRTVTGAHPVVCTIRKRVASNKGITSLRLSYAALSAGYKFLDVLTKAQARESPEYAQVVDHLQRHPPSTWIPPPKRGGAKPSSDGEKQRKPLLSKISKPGMPPEYTYNFDRPRESLTGARNIPSVSSTADGYPFVRLSKPQPQRMSQTIMKRIYKAQEYKLKIADIEDYEGQEALEEDEWDELMSKQMDLQGIRAEQGPAESVESKYSYNVQLARVWCEFRLEDLWQDWTARGDALNQLVERERELAIKEGSLKPLPVTERSGLPDQVDSSKLVVSPGGALRSTKATHAAMLNSEDALVENPLDPYTAPGWATTATLMSRKVLKLVSGSKKEWHSELGHLEELRESLGIFHERRPPSRHQAFNNKFRGRR